MIRRETLPPISDYGLIGNRHSCALIERSGTIDWCCLPHLDDASVFGALLDLRRGGHWRVGPAGRASTSRAYLGIAPVLVTEFAAGSGRLRLTDFLPIRRGRGSEVSFSAHSIVRTVECLAGEVEVEVEWRPRPNYARDDVELNLEGDAVRARSARCDLWLRGLPLEGIEITEATALHRFRMAGGERVDLICGMGEPDHEPVTGTARRLLEETMEWWERWGERSRIPPGAEQWSDLARRSGMVLKLLSNERSGAIAAARYTTSPVTAARFESTESVWSNSAIGNVMSGSLRGPAVSTPLRPA